MISLSFDPLLPVPILAAYGGSVIALGCWMLLRRQGGSLWRVLALLAVGLPLCGPHLRHEVTAPVPGRVVVLVDDSPSMNLEDRRAQAETLRQQVIARLRALGLTSVERTSRDSQLRTAIQAAVAQVPPTQLAGVVVISDGLAHGDLSPLTAPVPVHALIVGDPDARDSQIRITTAPPQAPVGQQATIDFAVSGHARDDTVEVMVDDQRLGLFAIPPDGQLRVKIPIAARRAHTISATLPPRPGDLNVANNTAHVTLHGVRERLRVLLITGEPYPGVRAWRNLLTSDPMVDLVHFTILRAPDRQDFTPIDELSLIAFPTRALFMETLDAFDLIIFDRYRQTGVLAEAELRNIVRRVRAGGGLLVVSGPESTRSADAFSRYAGLPPLGDTALRDILPGVIGDQISTTAFRPTVTAVGRTHPVTAPLAPQQATWGQWLRSIDATVARGTVVMARPDGAPLLLLDRAGQGRVAQILSDHSWLWARGYDGGGPYNELMRRLIHWLMAEPDLDENRLTLDSTPLGVQLTRHALTPPGNPARVQIPDGTVTTVPLRADGPGVWRASVGDSTPGGLYRATQDGLSATLFHTGGSSAEARDGAASLRPLRQIIPKRGGAVQWATAPWRLDARAAHSRWHGAGWLGMTPPNTRDVVTRRDVPLPPLALMLLAVGLWLLGWWRQHSRWPI